jgi:hypothetical protein
MASGGKRQGAGRKPGKRTRRSIQAQVQAGGILEGLGEEAAWKWAFQTAKKRRDAKTVVDILKYLTDRRDGKPKQALEIGNEHGKPFQIVNHIPRPKRDGDTS